MNEQELAIRVQQLSQAIEGLKQLILNEPTVYENEPHSDWSEELWTRYLAVADSLLRLKRLK